MSATFLEIALPISQQLSPGIKGASIISLTDGGYLLSFEERPEVIRLDRDLKEVWRRDLQAQNIRYVSCHISANADASLIGVSGYNDIRIFDAAGQLRWTFTHEPWNSFTGANCFFSPDNLLLWIIAPGDPDHLYVIRCTDFAMLDHYTLNGHQENNYNFMATPDKEKVLMEVAAGQDDASLFLIQLTDGKITLQELLSCNDRIAGNFSPNGNEFVTGPHNSEGIEIFAFPSFENTASLEQADLFASAAGYADSEDPDTLNFISLFLSDTTLLAFTRFGRLLLVNRQTMACMGELVAEGNIIQAYDDSWNVTTNPAAITEYAGDIVTVQVDQQRLVLTYGTGDIRWHDLSPLKDLAGLT
ncbi:hypothetical protein [Chitinophaga sp. RAB17]|uniref:hypothetical protein n=1 Tax=Chitinophaga sp. RAB17 TaxID=3233049 RepID=UPI003F917241